MTTSMIFFKELEQNRHDDNNITTMAWKQQPDDNGLTADYDNGLTTTTA